MSGLSANKTKISYKKGASSTFTELPDLMEVPEFGGAPEKIDVTVLSDTVKKYVPGIKDLGDLVFKFLYDNSSETSNYRVLKAMDDAADLFFLPLKDIRTEEFGLGSIRKGVGIFLEDMRKNKSE